jgi:hypothetical protein
MRSTVRARFWLEVVLAGLSGFLAFTTFLWRAWIEALIGFDPDHHSGAFEWAIVAGLLLLCVGIGVAARAEWRRPAIAMSAGS